MTKTKEHSQPIRNKKTGYKASNNGVCKGMKYEVGKTYTHCGVISICHSGFHYCKDIDDVFNYYYYEPNVVVIFEIEDEGSSITNKDKTVCDRIKIVRIVPPSEYNSLFKRHTFDDMGNIVRRVCTSGLVQLFEHDERGNTTRMQSGDTHWETWEFDKNDNLLRHEVVGGYWETWSYDDKNLIDGYASSETTKLETV